MTRGSVVRDGATIAYAVDGRGGDAPPVVLLHGFARNGWFWRDWVPPLTAAGHPVVRIDLRGCGASADPGPGVTFRTDELVADLVAVLETVTPNGAHVAGESAGGMLTAYTAAVRPDLVRSAGLISTPVRPSGADPNVKGAGFPSTEEAIETLGLDGWWLRSRELGGELTDPEGDRERAAQLARTPVPVALAMWAWIHDDTHDLVALAPTVDVPALVMAPGTSHGTNGAQQEQLAAALPQGRLRRYAELNHEMYYLHPARLAGDYAAFVASVDG